MRWVTPLSGNIQRPKAHHQFLSPYKKGTLYGTLFSVPSSIQLSKALPQTPVSSLIRSLPLAWLMGHRPAALVPHLQLILEGVWGGGFGWAVTPLEPEGLVAEGGALQAGWLWGQGLRLQLKGVTKGACAQAVQGLDTEPKGRREMSTSESCKDWADLSRNDAVAVKGALTVFHLLSRQWCSASVDVQYIWLWTHSIPSKSGTQWLLISVAILKILIRTISRIYISSDKN